jgi:signal transduction histidine kinase
VTDAASERDAVLHALDLTILGEYDEAKRLLEPLDGDVAGRLFLLICDLEQQDFTRHRALAVVRHEIGNALSIAQANLEGMADGVVPFTPARVESVLNSLKAAGLRLDDLRRLRPSPSIAISEWEPVQLDEAMRSALSSIEGLARAKAVGVDFKHEGMAAPFRADVAHLRSVLRKAFTDAVRYAPPGGIIQISCNAQDGCELTITIRDRAGQRTIGALQRILRVHLPVEPR